MHAVTGDRHKAVNLSRWFLHVTDIILIDGTARNSALQINAIYNASIMKSHHSLINTVQESQQCFIFFWLFHKFSHHSSIQCDDHSSPVSKDLGLGLKAWCQCLGLEAKFLDVWKCARIATFKNRLPYLTLCPVCALFSSTFLQSWLQRGCHAY